MYRLRMGLVSHHSNFQPHLTSKSDDAMMRYHVPAHFPDAKIIPETSRQKQEAQRMIDAYNKKCKDQKANEKHWPAWNEPFWDDSEHMRVNNCKAYALLDRSDIKHREGKPQPGDRGGCDGEVCAPLSSDDFFHPEEIVKRMDSDYPGELIWVNYNHDDGIPPCGYFKATLLIATDNERYDYHFARLDSNGYWSHKPGSSPVRNTDASGKLITDPRHADWTYDPHNEGTGWNYVWYKDFYVKSHSPDRAHIFEENKKRAQQQFINEPNVTYVN
jgi:hypothetical protein